MVFDTAGAVLRQELGIPIHYRHLLIVGYLLFVLEGCVF